MQIEIGIPLIIIGFLLPIGLYFLYKRYRKKKVKDHITSGEVFDKEGERFSVLEDGTEHSIPKLKSPSVYIAVNRLKGW